jgi:hypothetical protein
MGWQMVDASKEFERTTSSIYLRYNEIMSINDSIFKDLCCSNIPLLLEKLFKYELTYDSNQRSERGGFLRLPI